MTTPSCKDFLSDKVTIGGITIDIFSVVMSWFLVVSLIILLVRIAFTLYTQLAVYVKVLGVFVIINILTLQYQLTLFTLPTANPNFFWIALLFEIGYPIIETWLTIFFFQRDTSNVSVIRSVVGASIMGALLAASTVVAYLVSKSQPTAFLTCYLISAVFNLVVAITPWRLISNSFFVQFGLNRPRKAYRIWTFFLWIYYSFRILSQSLAIVNTSFECPYVVAVGINYVIVPLVLFKVITLDSKYLKHEYLILANSERDWVIGTNSLVDQNKRVQDIPKTKWKEIELLKPVGRGGFSDVFLGKWRGTQIAVKKLRIANLPDQDKKRLITDLIAESHMLKALRHPNIVQFLGLVVDPPHLALLTEFMQRGCLFDILAVSRDTVNSTTATGNNSGNLTGTNSGSTSSGFILSNKRKLKILIDTAKGMTFLHSCNPTIIHRDLKSPNILIDTFWNAKVADFGMSRVVSESHTMTHMGTPKWAAPEVLRCEEFNESADVWSFGVIVWEIVTNQAPYGDEPLFSVIKGIVEGTTVLKIPDKCPPVYQSIIKQCLNFDWKKRPSFINLLDTLEKYAQLIVTRTQAKGRQKPNKRKSLGRPINTTKEFKNYNSFTQTNNNTNNNNNNNDDENNRRSSSASAPSIVDDFADRSFDDEDSAWLLSPETTGKPALIMKTIPKLRGNFEEFGAPDVITDVEFNNVDVSIVPGTANKIRYNKHNVHNDVNNKDLSKTPLLDDDDSDDYDVYDEAPQISASAPEPKYARTQQLIGKPHPHPSQNSNTSTTTNNGTGVTSIGIISPLDQNVTSQTSVESRENLSGEHNMY